MIQQTGGVDRGGVANSHLILCNYEPIGEHKLTVVNSASIPEPQRKAWTKHQVNGFRDTDEFESEVVRHVETTLARSMFNCDETAAYTATSLAFRDRLILEWNRTQQRQTFADSKRVYYLSLEFLMGRALDNAMLNIGLKDVAKCGLPPLKRGSYLSALTYNCEYSWTRGAWFPCRGHH